MAECAALLPLRERARTIDHLLQSQWPAVADVALLAVGGYGRGELFPASDVDLLFVSRRSDLRQHLAPFLRDLWDRGLRVSQSVHTPEECAAGDERNTELAISLLDRRFLAGEQALFAELRHSSPGRLIPALVRLTRERHHRFEDTIYHMEPDIKDAPGGLRDWHVLCWLAKLEGANQPDLPIDLLLQIRTELHKVAQRDQNTLRFALQDQLSSKLGFKGPAELMRAYYRVAAQVDRACARRLESSDVSRSGLLKAFRDRSVKRSPAEFAVADGKVSINAQRVDGESAVRLIEFLAQRGAPLSADAEDRLRSVMWIPLTWSALRDIFSAPHADNAIRAMSKAGVFPKLFTALHAIESLVVRDYYHRYTVDEHTSIAMETAVRLREAQGDWGELARETPDFAALLLALLLHDSGKGFPAEKHEERSMRIAAEACESLGVPARETETVLYLIGAHLEMSRLMTTRDLTDPATARQMGASAGTTERLKMLTVLTYCDVSAVHPGALTPWRATLLWRLYLVTARYLTAALQTELGTEGMPARYTLTHTVEDLEQHHRMENEGRITALERSEGAYRLTVVTRDRQGVFARIAGALAASGMNIVRAEAFTNERRTAVDTFFFADPARTLELNPGESERLQRTVRQAVEGSDTVHRSLLARDSAFRAKRRAATAKIHWDNEAAPRATLYEVTASDRPGLLFDLSSAIAQAGCNIETVLADTEGDRVIDVFYVTQAGERLLGSDAEKLAVVLRSLTNAN